MTMIISHVTISTFCEIKIRHAKWQLSKHRNGLAFFGNSSVTGLTTHTWSTHAVDRYRKVAYNSSLSEKNVQKYSSIY